MIMAKVDLTQPELTTILQALDEAYYNTECLGEHLTPSDRGRMKRYKTVFEKLKPITITNKNIYALI